MRSFWCFISYRHADNIEAGRQWATWLHGEIERYAVPPELIGRVNERGDEIPARLFPVFRDETDLPVDSDLSGEINNALDNSRLLLVLCSPRSAVSPYVAQEILHFKRRTGEDRVLAAIVDGEPNTSWDRTKDALGFQPEDECFPEPLRHRLDADGNLDFSGRTEPIAADFRVTRDNRRVQGWTTPKAYARALAAERRLHPDVQAERVAAYREQLKQMRLKIMAGILGVSHDDLARRNEAYERQLALARSRTHRRWLSAVGALALLAVAGAVVAWFEMKDDANQKVIADKRALANLLEKEKTDESQAQSDFLSAEARSSRTSSWRRCPISREACVSGSSTTRPPPSLSTTSRSAPRS
jgi:hypothetical protein